MVKWSKPHSGVTRLRDEPGLVWPVATFALSGLVVFLLVGVVLALLADRQATAAATTEARDLTVADGISVVVPALSDQILDRQSAAIATLDNAVRDRVLSELVVRVKLWAPDGTILYSDEDRLIGRRFPLGPRELSALHTGQANADISDLSEPENEYERPYHKLLEVYDGIRTPDGHPLLFEAYLTYGSVAAASRRTFASLLPALLAGLGILFLVQLPLASSLARRVARSRRKEERLLQQAVDSAELERRHIAADLHDGVVQSLVGTSLSLSAAAGEAHRQAAPSLAAEFEEAARRLRQGVRDLRSLIVTMAPPRLHAEGLEVALADLISPLTSRGIQSSLDIDISRDLSEPVEHLIYRTAQEALRNTTRHSGASRVSIGLRSAGRDTELTVFDDGRGFTASEATARRQAGHMGLTLLSQLAEEAGGVLLVESGSGQGTTIRLRLPG